LRLDGRYHEDALIRLKVTYIASFRMEHDEVLTGTVLGDVVEGERIASLANVHGK